MKTSLWTLLLAGVLFVAPPLPAQEAAAVNDDIYGSQLMTVEERAAHRRQLQALKTEEERQRFRTEHHERMKARAAERGVTLADEPGQGPGRGAGMGQGDPRGPGDGKGVRRGPYGGPAPGQGQGEGKGQGKGQGQGKGGGKGR